SSRDAKMAIPSRWINRSFSSTSRATIRLSSRSVRAKWQTRAGRTTCTSISARPFATSNSPLGEARRSRTRWIPVEPARMTAVGLVAQCLRDFRLRRFESESDRNRTTRHANFGLGCCDVLRSACCAVDEVEQSAVTTQISAANRIVETFDAFEQEV